MTGADWSSDACSGVCAVVVTYHPRVPALEEQFTALARQVGGIVVVDNGSPEEACTWLEQQASEGRLTFIPLGTNTGIAAAQNVGIKWSAENGFDHVLLMDQDSVPSGGMVQALFGSAQKLASEGERVGAVGPCCIDPRNGQLGYFARFNAGRLQLIPCQPCREIIPASVLIASGCLIAHDVLKDVGYMEASLFIDEVDHEWCLRAIAQGYGIFGVCNALLHHTVGDKIVRLWFLGWRDHITHSPIRNYYRIRNILILLRRPYVWNVCGSFKIVCAIFIFIMNTLSGPSLRQLQLMLKGFWHGILNKTGRLDETRPRSY